MIRLFLIVLMLAFVGSSSLFAQEYKTYYGEDHALGDGALRSFVNVNEDGQAVAIGIELDEAALEGLPHHSEPPAFEHTLALPPDLDLAPFDHISVDWIPHGHEPHGIYDRPHFDFHFYFIDEAERDLILPTDEEFVAKGQRAPDAQFMPAGYVAPPDNYPVPRMGAHLADISSPEFHGEPFTSTLIWGSYDGQLLFIEPMVTHEFMLSLRDKSEPFVRPIPQPEAYQRAGSYPSSYSLQYDAERGVYKLTLEGMHWRDA